MSIVEVTNLTKKYKNFTAVDTVNLSVEEGEIFGMLGSNGAGKTTTIECITGLKAFDTGTITVMGKNVKTDLDFLNKVIGVQLQETVYQDNIRVREICELFTSFYDTPTDYKALLAKFDLTGKEKSFISKLSGGQRQKLSIILALIGNPKIVFLDELTTGLDPEARRDMWQYVKDLKKDGITVFMTTHYMEEAAYLCDRICLINEGKIIACDTVDHIIALSDIDMELTFQSAHPNLEEQLSHLKGVRKLVQDLTNYTLFTQDEHLITQFVLLCHEKNIEFSKLSITRPTLDDAFIKMMGGLKNA